MNYILSFINTYKPIFETLYYVSVFIALAAYFLQRKIFNYENNRDISLINIDLLKMFYQNIIPSYEKLKDNLQVLNFLNLQFSNYHVFFEINDKCINLNDEKLKDSVDSYLEFLSNKGKKDDYLKLSESILVELQIFALTLKLQSDTIKFDDINKIIAKKYMIIFERIFPCLMCKNDMDIYQECINLYKKLSHY